MHHLHLNFDYKLMTVNELKYDSYTDCFYGSVVADIHEIQMNCEPSVYHRFRINKTNSWQCTNDSLIFFKEASNIAETKEKFHRFFKEISYIRELKETIVPSNINLLDEHIDFDKKEFEFIFSFPEDSNQFRIGFCSIFGIYIHFLTKEIKNETNFITKFTEIEKLFGEDVSSALWNHLINSSKYRLKLLFLKK